MQCGSDGGVAGGWEEIFPFVAGFESVVEKKVSVDYVRRLICVLEPAVEVFSGVVDRGCVSPVSVRALFCAVTALARCQTVMAYAVEVDDLRFERGSLLEALDHEWELLLRRECLVEVECVAAVKALLDPSISTVWAVEALQCLTTARDICARDPACARLTRVVSVGQVLVVSDRGKPMHDVLSVHGECPVLPADVYRILLQRIQDVCVTDARDKPPDVLLAGCVDGFDTGCGHLDSLVVSKWLWLLLTNRSEMDGYCYQLLLPPGDRYVACLRLGVRPLVEDVLRYIDNACLDLWAQSYAVVRVCDDLHVTSAGNVDRTFMRLHIHRHIGMMKPMRDDQPDYYARALVDEFINKHKTVEDASATQPPLDATFESLSVSTDTAVGREFVDVASMLYSGVDEVVSPRVEDGNDAVAASFVHDDPGLDSRDSEIVLELYNRLTGGAVIDERYFERTYRRFQALRRRPRLERSDGRVYHVFEGFPADGGVGTGPWQIDKMWCVPGWRSYVAFFPAGDTRTVSFAVEGGCQDIRMDCSGIGALEFGDCKVKVEGTLLWFTNSLRVRVVARENVTLRVSVPDALAAVAIGSEMRRYMHIPGYAVVARSYEVVTGSVDWAVPMERRRRNSIAGCHVYVGQRYVERGRHRFKLGQLASVAPARMLLKTEPPEALQYISVCGMRLHPRTRDHVSVLVDLRNVELYVSVVQGAILMVSTAQIVRVREYELSVISAQEARLARERDA